ncbi:hypothetical protein [Kaarinaea lacus]
MLNTPVNIYTFNIYTLILAIMLAFPAFAHDEDDGDEKDYYPKLIPVPIGFQPEGVVKGRGHKAYVGSLKTGGIYEVNLVSGKGRLLVESAPGPAVGLAYDKRSDYIFVAGGPDGTVTVYNARDGKQKAVYAVTEPGTFVNDGIITREAAYFTDSFAPVIYRIPLKRNGRLAKQHKVETIVLSEDFTFIAGEFNGNGIESIKKGNALYVVNSITGQLYRIDPKTGNATAVSITNGDLSSGDGLLLKGKTLYVVQNFLNQIAQLKLSKDGLSATITNIITDAEFRIPTTVTKFGDALYAINARFDVAPPPFPGYPPADPDLEYNLVRVEIPD